VLPWAIYSRVSRVGDRTDTLISPDLQIGRVQAFAEARGLPVVTMPPELDVSGGKRARPILDRVIEGVESGVYAGIIVAQLDRLSRMNLVDALQTIERIEAANGEVIAVAENFDASTPEGRLSRNMFLSLAQMQLDRYKLQFRVAKAQAVARGIWPVPRVPVGYRKRTDRTLEPDPATAPAVVRAFEARAAGESWAKVGDVLGCGQTQAGKVVRNPVYLGRIVYGEWVNPAAHEPVVSRDLWEAAQLQHPRPARRGGARALLAGLVRCAGCGWRMTPTVQAKGGYVERAYRCTPARKRDGRCEAPAIISQAKLDPHVERVALAHIGALSISASDRSEKVDRATSDLEAAEAELSAYQQATSVLGVGGDAFGAGLTSRLATVEEARRVLAGARLAAPAVPDAGELGELWPGLSVQERGHVLRGALSVVWVRKGRGPVEDRVRVVDSSVAVSAGTPPVWESDIPGEVGAAGA
jgi:DNA invertase Pin-like site-specific DNA recombinase